jgi:hypothetical protein
MSVDGICLTSGADLAMLRPQAYFQTLYRALRPRTRAMTRS